MKRLVLKSISVNFEICIYPGRASEEAPGALLQSMFNSPEETSTLTFIKVTD